MSFLLKGLAIGFSIAAPVGPIGVLCIRRTLASGRLCGLLSGLGAATADAFYGCVAGFGLTLVSGFLMSHTTTLRLTGGAFLLYLGARAFVAAPRETQAEPLVRGLLGAYVSTLVLTLTNPVTIIYFAAIFSGLGLAGSGLRPASATLLVSGVFIGSVLWWLTLSTGAGVLRTRIDATAMRWINRGSGVVIAGFGAAALLAAF